MKTLNGTRFMALAACLALALGAASPAAAQEEEFTGFYCTIDWTGFAPPVNGSTTFTSSEETVRNCKITPEQDEVTIECKTKIPDWPSSEDVFETGVECLINVGRCGALGEFELATDSKLQITTDGNADLECEYDVFK